MQSRHQAIAFEHEPIDHRSLSQACKICITKRDLDDQTWNVTQKDDSCAHMARVG